MLLEASTSHRGTSHNVAWLASLVRLEYRQTCLQASKSLNALWRAIEALIANLLFI